MLIAACRSILRARTYGNQLAPSPGRRGHGRPGPVHLQTADLDGESVFAGSKYLDFLPHECRNQVEGKPISELSIPIGVAS
jgi:hypothetical protein